VRRAQPSVDVGALRLQARPAVAVAVLEAEFQRASESLRRLVA